MRPSLTTIVTARIVLPMNAPNPRTTHQPYLVRHAMSKGPAGSAATTTGRAALHLPTDND